MTALQPNKCFSFVKTITMLETYFTENLNKWPEVLIEIK